MEIKLKRNLTIEFRLIKDIGDNFGVTAIVLQIQRLSYRAPFKGNSDNFGRFHPQLPSTDALSPHRPFGYKQKGNERMGISHCSFGMETPLLGRSRSGVGVGVGVDIFRPESELESESFKICRLRSPGPKNEGICLKPRQVFKTNEVIFRGCCLAGSWHMKTFYWKLRLVFDKNHDTRDCARSLTWGDGIGTLGRRRRHDIPNLIPNLGFTSDFGHFILPKVMLTCSKNR